MVTQQIKYNAGGVRARAICSKRRRRIVFFDQVTSKTSKLLQIPSLLASPGQTSEQVVSVMILKLPVAKQPMELIPETAKEADVGDRIFTGFDETATEFTE